MMTPIPAVKPAMTGLGMYLITAPNRANPNTSRITPAMRVAICRPAMPCCAVMMESTATNAPVGPEIWARVPPNIDVRSAATMAVYNPCSGRAPEAMANAMASGKATMPTTKPATTLLGFWERDHKPAAFPSSSAIMPAIACGVVRGPMILSQLECDRDIDERCAAGVLARAQYDLAGVLGRLKIERVFQALHPASDILALHGAGDDQGAHPLVFQDNGLGRVAVDVFKHVTQRLQAECQMPYLPSRRGIVHFGRLFDAGAACGCLLAGIDMHAAQLRLEFSQQ